MDSGGSNSFTKNKILKKNICKSLKIIIFMRNLFLAVFTTIMFSFTGNAQSPTGYRIITGEKLVNFNLKLKTYSVVNDAGATLSADEEQHYIKYKFTFDEKMASFTSESELLKFLESNKADTYGKLELYVDNNLEYSVTIEKGIKVKEENFISDFSKAYPPCSFEGLRRCAANRIRDQNWFDMTACVLSGFSCFATHYASCFADNCT